MANGSPCTVPPGTTINVTTANGVGVSASGSGGGIDASGVTIRPAAAGATAALAQSGGAVRFDNGVVDTNSVNAAATGQRGLRAIGAGSAITAANATIDMTTASGTASNMVGVSAEDQATITIQNTRVLMGGGANGTGNYGVQALGAGARIDVVGGEVSTASRGAFGVRATDGGLVALSSGTRITTSGAQNTSTLAGSHALLASGTNSQITGSGVFASTSGAMASGARAELGGRIDLIGGVLTTTAAGTAAAPSAAARVISGGRMTMTGVGGSITTQGAFNYGVGVSEASSFSGADLAVSTEGASAVGLAFDGSSGDLARVGVSTLGSAAHGVQASGGASSRPRPFRCGSPGRTRTASRRWAAPPSRWADQDRP